MSKAGIRDIMKDEWEHGIKPQYKPGNVKKEYIVGIPAEAFTNSSLDDSSKQPIIKNGRIHFSRYDNTCMMHPMKPTAADLFVTSNDIQKVFTDVFLDIEKLINEQIQSASNNGLRVTVCL